jgi:hypothetical protein
MVLSLNSFAQNEKMNSSSRMFEKRIEPSMFPSGTDNLKNKTKMQLLFFPDYNGMIEFLVEPSFCGAYGFRITISNNQYILEAKQIYNWKEVRDSLRAVYPLKIINGYDPQNKLMSREAIAEIAEYNTKQLGEIKKVAPLKYKLEEDSISISSNMANLLYRLYVDLIENYSNKGVPVKILDGEYVTFRCVVDDEVWNFSISNPSGNFRRLADICEEMAKEVFKDKEKIIETEYIKQLEELLKIRNNEFDYRQFR